MLKKVLMSMAMVMFAASCFAAVGIQVSPNTWAAGTGGAGSYTSADNYFSIHNMGDQPAQLKIRAGNMIPSGWVLADSPDLNQFSLEWGGGGIWNHVSGSDSVLKDSLAVDGLYNFALQLKTPTSINPVVTDQQTTPITISATPGVPEGMVLVPAGDFTGGGTSGGYVPSPYTVYLEAYYIDKYEVTNGQFKQFIDAGGYSNSYYWTTESWNWKTANNITKPAKWDDTTFGLPGGTNLPVAGITWYEASAYAKWAGKRLPTGAEWEKAARGTDGRTYPWGEGIDSGKCNYNNSIGHTVNVGSYESGKSPYDCYDMSGNVWEWCQDSTGEITRVYHGGGFSSDSNNCNPAAQYGTEPGYRNFVESGFRCARNAQ